MIESLLSLAKSISTETAISVLSLVMSTISIGIHWYNLSKSKRKLDVSFDHSDSFYFEGIDTIGGNRDSLVVSINIFNESSMPITINKINIVINEIVKHPCAKSNKIPYPEHWDEETYNAYNNNGFIVIKSVDCEGLHSIDLDNNMIKCPIRLNPFDGISGFLVFPIAGCSSGNKTKTKLEFITSRGVLNFKESFESTEHHKNNFQ